MATEKKKPTSPIKISIFVPSFRKCSRSLSNQITQENAITPQLHNTNDSLPASNAQIFSISKEWWVSLINQKSISSQNHIVPQL